MEAVESDALDVSSQGVCSSAQLEDLEAGLGLVVGGDEDHLDVVHVAGLGARLCHLKRRTRAPAVG